MPALDKQSALDAAATDARKALILATRRLDPRFPYAAIPFDPEFFQVPIDPEPPAS